MKIRKPCLSALPFLAGVFALSGCASIFSESIYPVNISSSPSGAQIRIVNRDGQEVHTGTTPTQISLSASAGFFRRQEYIIEASKDGKTARTALVADFDGWYLANLTNIAFSASVRLQTGDLVVYGDLIGALGALIVDPATGAMWKLDSLKHIELHANDDGPDADESALRIMDIEELPEEARAALIPVH